MKRWRISQILGQEGQTLVNQEITVKGWVRAFRSNRFIQLNDGSCMASIQAVVDFEKFDDILNKWENPTPQPFKEQGCLQYYLLEHDACDQFSVVYEQGDKVGVYLNTQPEPSLLEERPVSIY